MKVKIDPFFTCQTETNASSLEKHRGKYVQCLKMSAPGGKRLVNSKSGLKIQWQHDKDASPWELAEPQWIPDTQVSLFFCHGQ